MDYSIYEATDLLSIEITGSRYITLHRDSILTVTTSCVILSISYKKFVDDSGAWGEKHAISYTKTNTNYTIVFLELQNQMI